MFFELVKLLEAHDLIKSKYKIIANCTFHATQKLTISNIFEEFVLDEKLSI